MRRSFMPCLAFLLLVLALPVSAEKSFSMGTGIGVDYQVDDRYFTLGGIPVEMHAKTYFMSANLFMDAYYALCRIQGAFQVGPTTIAVPGMADSESASAISNFAIGLYAKYPVSVIKGVELSPLLGFDAMFNIDSAQRSLYTPTMVADSNSLFLSGGFLLDIYLDAHVYLRPEFIFGWNLMIPSPEQLKAMGEPSRGSEYRFSALLSLGWVP